MFGYRIIRKKKLRDIYGEFSRIGFELLVDYAKVLRKNAELQAENRALQSQLPRRDKHGRFMSKK